MTGRVDAGETADAAVGAGPAGARVEIVTIGDELLLGETVDDNSAWLGRRLAGAGFRVIRRATVGDDGAAIRDAVRRGLDRAGTVLCTGGLGPTRDDVTKPAVAALFGRELRFDDAVLDDIRRRFDARGWKISEASRSQAEVPAGAVVFPNRHGTAPGLALEDDAGRIAVLLPGVPREMRALVDAHVLPFLVERRPRRARPVRHRVLRTTGIAESRLAARLDDLLPALAPLTVAFLPSLAGVDLRVTSWGELDADDVAARLDDAEAKLRGRVGRFVYGRDGEELVDAVAGALTARSLTLAVAESCTGGLIGERLTERPGASRFLAGGVVAYADDAKRRLLGVDEATLRRHGAVSRETAAEMLDGARSAFDADAAVAVTGIAGPGGGSPDKPVGTVCYGAAVGDAVEIRRFEFPGDREEVRVRSAQAVLALLWRMLREAGT